MSEKDLIIMCKNMEESNRIDRMEKELEYDTFKKLLTIYPNMSSTRISNYILFIKQTIYKQLKEGKDICMPNPFKEIQEKENRNDLQRTSN